MLIFLLAINGLGAGCRRGSRFFFLWVFGSPFGGFSGYYGCLSGCYELLKNKANKVNVCGKEGGSWLQERGLIFIILVRGGCYPLLMYAYFNS